MNYELHDNRIWLYDSYNEKDQIKTIFGRLWHKDQRAWSVPLNNTTVDELKSMFGIVIEENVKDALPITKFDHKLEQAFIPSLYDHQVESVKLGITLRDMADLSDPGTGKTMVAIELMLQRNQFPCLVVAPKSILNTVWKAEVQAVNLYLKPEFQLETVVLEGGSAKIKTQLHKYRKLYDTDGGLLKRNIFVINYDIIDAVRAELAMFKYGMMVLDESTKIKTPQAKRSKALIRLGDHANHKHIMTGTLAPNGLIDAFNQIRFLSREVFGDSWYHFRHHYFTQNPFNQYDWELKPHSIEDFNNRILSFTIQHKKKDCVSLPPITEEVRMVSLGKASRDAYNEMKEEALLEIEKLSEENEVTGSQVIIAPFKITQLMKLRQLASGFIYHDDEASIFTSEKINELKDILEEINDKVIIFTHFKASRDRVAEALSDKAVVFDGDKEEALEQFKGEAQYLVANMASAAHGLNLQFCSNIVNYELDYNLENYLQAMDRINRIGQKNKMTIYHLQTERTIDQLIYNKLKGKEDLSGRIGVHELKRSI